MPVTRQASALANPQYKLLFWGNVATMLGFGMMQVVQGVLAFDLTGTNSSVGFVTMAAGIPMVLLGPFGGVLSDRFSKRMLLGIGQVLIGGAFFLIGLLTVLDYISIGILAAITLVLGCTFATLLPARQAWVGEMLRGPALSNGIALQQLSMNATRIVGPLAAGALIAVAVIGTGGTYMAMSVFFAVSVALLLFMQPTKPRDDQSSTSLLGDLKEGLRYISGNGEVRLLMLLFAGVVLSGFSYQQLMPGFLENELGQPTNRVGLMFGATAIGGIGLSFFFVRRDIGDDSLTVMLISGALLSGSLVLLAVAPTFLTALGAAVLVGGASSGFQMSNQIRLMQYAEPAFLGRVVSLTMTAFGLQMIVAFPVGAFADAAGERMAMWALAALCLAVVSLGTIAARLRTAGSKPPTN